MMGADGPDAARRKVAILNANYIAQRLEPHYPGRLQGRAAGASRTSASSTCASSRSVAGIEVDDVAKRLMDYGFHAPTMSFPIPGTLMIEPTESEVEGRAGSLLRRDDRDPRRRSREIEAGKMPREDNLLKNAPHTAGALLAAEWPHPYSRERAAFPLPYVRAAKFWPSVGRLNNVLGDRKLFCTCPDVSEYA